MNAPSSRIEACILGFPRKKRSYELWGELPPGPRLAVVGSRAAWTRDKPGVQKLVELAAKEGMTLVSGGALGVDGWMHQAALEQGVPQLAVLPCARDALYPPDHAMLFEGIAASGNSGVLFTVEVGQPWMRHQFVARNEIVVRVASAVVVVQCQLRSGSTWTARRALALQRRLGVFEGSPGVGALIEAGAASLGGHEDSDRPARITAWLRDEPLPCSGASWPAHLGDLRREFSENAEAARSIDDFRQPLLAAAQLGEAQALGLVREVGPGRYVVVR